MCSAYSCTVYRCMHCIYIHIFCVPNSALRMYDTCEAIINTWAPIGRLSMYKQTQRQRIEQLLIIENSMTPIHRQRQWAERCYVQKHMFDACTSIVYRCIVPNGRRIYWERERDGEWHKNKFYDINIDRPKKYIRIYSKNSTSTARTSIVWNTTQWNIRASEQ